MFIFEQSKIIMTLIKKHQSCIEILENIEHFETQKKNISDSIKAIGENFPGLAVKYNRKVEIYDMCIVRLHQRYRNLVNQF